MLNILFETVAGEAINVSTTSRSGPTVGEEANQRSIRSNLEDLLAAGSGRSQQPRQRRRQQECSIDLKAPCSYEMEQRHRLYVAIRSMVEGRGGHPYVVLA